MPKSSIARRIVISVVLSQVLLTCGLVAAGISFARHRVNQAFDSELKARAIRVAALVRYSEDTPDSLIFDTQLLPKPPVSGPPDFYKVSASASGIMGQSWPAESLTNSVPPRPERKGWNFTAGGVPYRAIVLEGLPVLDRETNMPAPSAQTLTAVYAAPSVKILGETREAGFSIAAAGVALIALSVLLTFWAVRRGLAPMRDLAVQAGSISSTHWNFEPPALSRDLAELAPLVTALQTMLARLQDSFSKQREFVADAAHELRTPIAILKSSLQLVLQRDRSPLEYRTSLEQLLEDSKRFEKLVQKLLQLARAEQASSPIGPTHSLPLTDVAISCILALDRVRPFSQTRNVELVLDAADSALVRADEEDLETVWVNLIENAIRYSPPGAVVKVTIARKVPNFLQVVVEDQGPGIAEHELERIFERFHRGDPSRARESGGFGLGLAIAKSLVEGCGGKISAASVVGRGTRMCVTLPETEEATATAPEQSSLSHGHGSLS
jgi:signal transduction histidine kinase